MTTLVATYTALARFEIPTMFDPRIMKASIEENKAAGYDAGTVMDKDGREWNWIVKYGTLHFYRTEEKLIEVIVEASNDIYESTDFKYPDKYLTEDCSGDEE